MKRKFSFFQWACIFLIAILVCAIIIQFCIMASLKNKQDEYKDKLNNLPEITDECKFTDNINYFA